MKSMIEYMTTMVITLILVFTFTIIISVGLQIMNARQIHTSGIEVLQSSYYGVTQDDLNSTLDEGWRFEITELNSVNTRKDYEVILYYLIRLPLFSETPIEGRFVGYAR